MREQIAQYTQNLERLVSEKTQQLLEAERVAAIGQTVATLAHAIKNIIAGLSGGVFVVEKGMELDNRTYLSQGWNMIKGDVGKIKTLALDLLNYSKAREPDYDLCDPNIPAREVYHLMAAQAEQDGVQLRLDLNQDLAKTYMDLEGIHTSLLNLVTNAMDACLAMPETSPRDVTIRTLNLADWAVEYQVIDTGCGMARTVAECVAALDGVDVPCAPVQRIDQVVADPQVRARNMIIEQEHRELGKVRLANVPFKFSDSDPTPTRPAPLMGEHNREIAAELGFAADEMDAMVRDGVLYAEPAAARPAAARQALAQAGGC